MAVRGTVYHGKERLQRGSLCVDTQYAGGVYLQPVLGGQVHRQTSLPSLQLPLVTDKTYAEACRCMFVCRCMPAGVRAVLVCHSIVPTSTIPFSWVKGRHCISSMLRRTNISLFVLRLRDLMNVWRYQIICQCLSVCSLSNGPEGELFSPTVTEGRRASLLIIQRIPNTQPICSSPYAGFVFACETHSYMWIFRHAGGISGEFFTCSPALLFPSELPFHNQSHDRQHAELKGTTLKESYYHCYVGSSVTHNCPYNIYPDKDSCTTYIIQFISLLLQRPVCTVIWPVP